MSLILNILEMGNYNNPKATSDRKALLLEAEYPGVEFKHLPLFIKQWFTTVRIALGDFDFGEST